MAQRTHSIDDSALNTTEQEGLVNKESHHMVGSKSYKFYSAKRVGLGEIDNPKDESEADNNVSKKFLIDSVKEFYECKN